MSKCFRETDFGSVFLKIQIRAVQLCTGAQSSGHITESVDTHRVKNICPKIFCIGKSKTILFIQLTLHAPAHTLGPSDTAVTGILLISWPFYKLQRTNFKQ